MMTKEKDGGPAFPAPQYADQGLTKREYFASRENSEMPSDFLDFYVAEVIGLGYGARRPITCHEWIAALAAWRYACADAMLAEGVKK